MFSQMKSKQFPQLARQPGDLFTDHPLYKQRSVVLRKKKAKKGKLKVRHYSLYYSLVTLKFTVHRFSDISC